MQELPKKIRDEFKTVFELEEGERDGKYYVVYCIDHCGSTFEVECDTKEEAYEKALNYIKETEVECL